MTPALPSPETSAFAAVANGIGAGPIASEASASRRIRARSAGTSQRVPRVFCATLSTVIPRLAAGDAQVAPRAVYP